jgi:hypothetical protein
MQYHSRPLPSGPTRGRASVGSTGHNQSRRSAFSAGLVLGTLTILVMSSWMPSGAAISPPGQSTFKVAFNEAGLPKNTPWSVDLSGTIHSSNGNWIIFPQIPNGTYTFSISTSDTRYSPDPGNGNVTVAGLAVYPVINFTVETYPVTFEESGLPAGAVWSVSLNGTQVTSNNSTLVIDKHNGTFPFSVSAANGLYAPRPGDGYVTVNGGARLEYIAFNAYTYPVRFVRSDFYSGLVNVQIGTAAYSVPANSTVTVDLVNGTYTYTALAGGGVNVTGGSFTVAGAGATIPLVILCGSNVGCVPPPNLPTTGPSPSSLPGGVFVVAVISVVAAALLVSGGIVAWRSWRRSEERANREATPPRGFG